MGLGAIRKCSTAITYSIQPNDCASLAVTFGKEPNRVFIRSIRALITGTRDDLNMVVPCVVKRKIMKDKFEEQKMFK